MKLKLKLTMFLVVALGLIPATGAHAQLTVANSTLPPGFGQAGIIQSATLNPAPIRAGDKPGGTLTINGITMIVPDNTVIQMPANTLQWSDLFDPIAYTPIYDPAIPAPVQPNLTITAGATGLALSDNLNQAIGKSPWMPFNAIVEGNIDVRNSTGYGFDAYIVGLILPIDQDLGCTGAGVVTFINYEKGRFEVGGVLGKAGTGTIIEINDPNGRFGVAHSHDPRWSVDSDNPTVITGNGYPMGLPRVAPANGFFPAAGEVGDPDRPYYNRPMNPASGVTTPFPHDPFLQVGAPLIVFDMPAKAAPNVSGDTTPDPWKQIPLMIGDYVGWAGVLCKLNPAAPLIPYNPALPISAKTNLPLNRQTYISANTVEADKLAVHTAQGTQPCYMATERMVIGNGGGNVTLSPRPRLGIDGGIIPLPEQVLNIVINGFVTDSTQLVDIYAIDIDSATGAEQPRLLGTVLPEPGFANGRGNKGRFRFEIGKGNFLPATRVYMVQSQNGTVTVPNQTGTIKPLAGLLSGQYHAPMFTFLFPDAPPGFPTIPNNFNTIPFLTQGEGGNPSVGPLNPQPPVQ